MNQNCDPVRRPIKNRLRAWSGPVIIRDTVGEEQRSVTFQVCFVIATLIVLFLAALGIPPGGSSAERPVGGRLRGSIRRGISLRRSLGCQDRNRSHCSIAHELSVRGIASIAARMDCGRHLLGADENAALGFV